MPLIHPFPPFMRPDSRVLILGSFPSVRSRAEGFYYGHPQNRFWLVLSALFEVETPTDTNGKQRLLTERRIALWDVIASCDITGSSDGSIKNAAVNPIANSIAGTNIQTIFLNGGMAAKLYHQKASPKPDIPALAMPSTSAANAAWRLPQLIQAWGAIKDYL